MRSAIRYLTLSIVFLGLILPVWGSNQIQIDTQLVSGNLIPSIKINDDTVMILKSRGEYVSNFERAEQIYTVLKELDEKEIDLSQIRIRRYRGEYTGNVGRIKIFSVTQTDTQGTTTTPYKLAKSWATNIQNAIKNSKSTAVTSTPKSDDATQTSGRFVFPILSVFNIQNEASFLAALAATIVGIGLQIIIAWGTVWFYHRKNPPNRREILELKRQLELNRNTLADLLKKSTSK